MKYRFLFCLIATVAFAVSAPAQSDTWQLDPAHSSAQFAVRHMTISTVRGAFTKLSGTVQYDPQDPAKTSIDVTIDANSIDTRIEKRDSDVKGPNLLDTAKYPTITFKSKRVESAGGGKLKIIGDLTIHGVTKEVVLDVDGPTGPIKDPRGNQKMGASGTTTIKRQDFGVSGMPSAVIGDDIAITLDVEVGKKAAPASAQ
jgi:polyisoprenoid-binding protein YceI